MLHCKMLHKINNIESVLKCGFTIQKEMREKLVKMIIQGKRKGVVVITTYL